MGLRTDMALESAQSVKTGGKLPQGIEISEQELDGISLREVEVKTEEASKKIGKPKGLYYTFEMKDTFGDSKKIGAALCETLRKLIGESESVLVIGLGNEDITPDSLGGKTCDRILATRHIKKNLPELESLFDSDVSVVKTGVMGKTGIESSEIAKAVCESVSPSCVICIDALCCKEVSHLGKSLQITDVGICPGSGVNNSRKELSKKTLGAKCIAIGAPTVCGAEEKNKTVVTACDIDRIIKFLSQAIALAINMALHPKLSQNDLENLTN